MGCPATEGIFVSLPETDAVLDGFIDTGGGPLLPLTLLEACGSGGVGKDGSEYTVSCCFPGLVPWAVPISMEFER